MDFFFLDFFSLIFFFRETATHSCYVSGRSTTIMGQIVPRSFVCQECDIPFKNQDQINLHLDVIHGNELRRCDRCPKTFQSIVELSRHRVDMHTTFKCTLCKTKFNSRPDVLQDLATHHQLPFFRCTMCDEKFVTILDGMKHSKDEHDNLSKVAVIVNDPKLDCIYETIVQVEKPCSLPNFNHRFPKMKETQGIKSVGNVFGPSFASNAGDPVYLIAPKVLPTNFFLPKPPPEKKETPTLKKMKNDVQELLNSFPDVNGPCLPPKPAKRKREEKVTPALKQVKDDVHAMLKSLPGDYVMPRSQPPKRMRMMQAMATEKQISIHSVRGQKLAERPPSDVVIKYMCNLCKKAFNTQTEIKEDVASHMQYPYLKCDLCDHEFLSKHSGLKHLTDDHEGGGKIVEKPNDETFKKMLNKTVTRLLSKVGKGQVQLPSKSRVKEGSMYKCRVCDKKSIKLPPFPDQTSILIHVKEHFEEPVQCSECDVYFPNPEEGQTHLETSICYEGELLHVDDEARSMLVQNSIRAQQPAFHKISIKEKM